MRPIVLTIAGSDCSGGAGIQADLKAIEANLGFGAAVITAVTAQNTRGVGQAFALPAAQVDAQLEAVFGDLEVAAVKTGMLADASIVEVVACRLRSRPTLPVVCDPVLRASSGFPLLDVAGVESLRRNLLPLASVLTPNAEEAAALSGLPVRDADEARRAGERLLELGTGAVLVTGGHLARQPGTDVLVTSAGHTEIPGEFLDVPHTHGSGCTLSAALAVLLARGLDLHEAAVTAKRFVVEAIRHGLPLGSGAGPTDPFYFLQARRAGRLGDAV